MVILLFIFAFSSLALFVMLAFRVRELKAGKIAVPEATAPLLPIFNLKTPTHILNREDVIILYDHTRAQVVEFAYSLYLQIKRTPKPRFVQKAIDMVNGRNTITIKREVDSPFIRTIVEHKEKMRGQRNNASDTLSSI
ncbi:MAG TPA: hypothetical protein VJB70_01385 [Candidatus Paceibacterota bacterium]